VIVVMCLLLLCFSIYVIVYHTIIFFGTRQVENMSHFTCDLGTRYFPFGRLDKQLLQQQLANHSFSDNDNNSNNDGTEDIPIISFPLSSVMSQQQSGGGGGADGSSRGKCTYVAVLDTN
jgi:hypothetical protein